MTAGVIGQKRFQWDIWGDTVNVASRMESSSVPMYIQVSQSTHELVRDKYLFEERNVYLKGKGDSKGYLIVGRQQPLLSSGASSSNGSPETNNIT